MYQKLLENFKKLSNLYLFSYISAKNSISEEAIHQLRVSVKKIRAIIKFTIFLCPENDYLQQRIIPLRKVFKQAALLRDIHIIKHLVFDIYSDKISDKKFEIYLNKQEKKGKRSFKRSKLKGSRFFSFLADAYKELDVIYVSKDSEELVKTYDQMIVDQVEKLYQQVKLSSSDDDLHKVRIILKALIHIMSIRNTTESLKFLYNLNELADSLGLWHDHVILINHLEYYLNKKESTKNDIVELKNFNVYLKNENRKRADEIKLTMIKILDSEQEN